ncbi:MAG: hypothetical protein IT359_06950 [Gemmatimonadaceae bacterium]|nr:hypothetical protein [Gemmatimonadaceae bacterium]
MSLIRRIPLEVSWGGKPPVDQSFVATASTVKSTSARYPLATIEIDSRLEAMSGMVAGARQEPSTIHEMTLGALYCGRLHTFQV